MEKKCALHNTLATIIALSHIFERFVDRMKLTVQLPVFLLRRAHQGGVQKRSLILKKESFKLLTTSSSRASVQPGFYAQQQQQYQQSSIVLLAGAVGLGAIITTSSYLSSQQGESSSSSSSSYILSSPTKTRCEQAGVKQHHGGDSISFQVAKALEMNDEIQRIRTAQILHDLHELAMEKSQLRRRQTVRKLWKFLKRKTGLAAASDEQQGGESSSSSSSSSIEDSMIEKETNVISLGRRINLEHLSSEKGQDLIEQIANGKRLDEASLVSLLDASELILRKDSTLVDLRERTGKVFVVGDLHGSLSALQRVLETIGPIGGQDDKMVVFDGDFVDRGSESLEVICILLLLKLAYPNHVVLLRGNHEDVLVASAYGFHDELNSKYGDLATETIWDSVDAVFCALPLVAVTKTAAILHGGIPHEDFNLEDVQAISTDERCSVKTTVMNDNQDEIHKLVQGILWSDPSPRNGIRHNSARTLGKIFGPDVSQRFLHKCNLKYLVRGHEVAENGTSILQLDDDHSVMTVFSQPAYPEGLGTNKGAVLELDASGSYRSIPFTHLDPPAASKFNEQKSHDDLVGALRSLIDSRRHRLEEAFQALAPNGKVSTLQWAKVMEESLEIRDASWTDLLPALVPVSAMKEEEGSTTCIDWRVFLKNDINKDSQMQNLRSNHRMLMAVYRFLDVNGDGVICMEEFKVGIDLLNRRLPKYRKLQAEVLFHQLDLDRSGEIDLDEFSHAFNAI